jgi:hypothetical protein
MNPFLSTNWQRAWRIAHSEKNETDFGLFKRFALCALRYAPLFNENKAHRETNHFG